MQPAGGDPARPDPVRGRPGRAAGAVRRPIRLDTTDQGRALELCRAAAGLRDVSQENGDIRFAAERSAAAALTVDLGRAGVGIHALVPEGATLEELFFELTEEAAE